MRLVLVYAVASRVLLGGLEFDSFNVFQVAPPDFKQASHRMLAPALDSACRLNLEGLDGNGSLANYTALAIIPTTRCHDYLVPLADFATTARQLTKRGFAPVSAVIFCQAEGQRLPSGSPDSTIYSPSAGFVPWMNISYHVAPQPSLASLLSGARGLEGVVVNELNPWSVLLDSPAQFAWTVAFRVLKFLLLMVQFILCGFVCARTQFRARLQMFLLAVGILQLGGEQVLSWAAADGLTVRLYAAAMLLPACIVNSMVVLSWCNIVWRLKTSVIIWPFKAGAVCESVTLGSSIVVQLFLVMCLDRWIGNGSVWFGCLRLLLLLTMAVFPTLMGVWFFRVAQNFCPIFHATAKLINAQWFTMFILLTRVFFIVNLLSYCLTMLWVESPARYVAFHTMNEVSTVAYNVMIVLTVLKMQAITPIQHRWTPDQLGLATLPDGTVVCQQPDDQAEEPPAMAKFPSTAQSIHRLLPSSVPRYPAGSPFNPSPVPTLPLPDPFG